MRIILGSKSAGRKKILESMGYIFEILDPNIDEKAIRYQHPTSLTLALALAKAEALLPRIEGEALLITSDQVVVYRGCIREKPVDSNEAIKFLQGYNFFPAKTVTSVVVTNTKTHRKISITDTAKIFFSNIPQSVIEKYVATGDAYYHAGGFDYEHELLSPYVQKIEGEKESIIGLPKKLTGMLLAEMISNNK